MSGKDYDNLSLGKRINVFDKLSDDETLVKELLDFTKKRNVLSHRASRTVSIPMVNSITTACPNFRVSLLPSRLRPKD
jgi:hypothetical protein